MGNRLPGALNLVVCRSEVCTFCMLHLVSEIKWQADYSRLTIMEGKVSLVQWLDSDTCTTWHRALIFLHSYYKLINIYCRWTNKEVLIMLYITAPSKPSLDSLWLLYITQVQYWYQIEANIRIHIFYFTLRILPESLRARRHRLCAEFLLLSLLLFHFPFALWTAVLLQVINLLSDIHCLFSLCVRIVDTFHRFYSWISNELFHWIHCSSPVAVRCYINQTNVLRLFGNFINSAPHFSRHLETNWSTTWDIDLLCSCDYESGWSDVTSDCYWRVKNDADWVQTT